MAVAVAKTPRLSRTRRRELFYGILFASPWLIGFVLWMIIPVLSSAYYSLTRYDLLRPPVFIGLTNYVNLASDNDFYLVLWNTLWWVVLSAPLGVASAFLMAVLLNTKIIARSTFRAIFFFPSIVPVIVVASVWNFLLNIQFGAINSTLRALELPAIPFLSNPAYTKPTLLMIHMWAQGSAMVIFLATLQDVPRELYEAATIDGASYGQFFVRMAVPLSMAIISVIGLYYLVQHWNDFFTGLVFVRDYDKQPLQIVLRDILISNQAFSGGAGASGGSGGGSYAQRYADQIKYGVIVVSTLPVIVLYPFLQRYFEKGVMIGSVKG